MKTTLLGISNFKTIFVPCSRIDILARCSSLTELGWALWNYPNALLNLDLGLISLGREVSVAVISWPIIE